MVEVAQVQAWQTPNNNNGVSSDLAARGPRAREPRGGQRPVEPAAPAGRGGHPYRHGGPSGRLLQGGGAGNVQR